MPVPIKTTNPVTAGAPAMPSGSDAPFTPYHRFSDRNNRKYGANYVFSRLGLPEDLNAIISGTLIDPSGWARNTFDPQTYEVNASGYIDISTSGLTEKYLHPDVLETVTTISFGEGAVNSTFKTVPLWAPAKGARPKRFILTRATQMDSSAVIASGAANSYNIAFKSISGALTSAGGAIFKNFHTGPGGWGVYGGGFPAAPSAVVLEVGAGHQPTIPGQGSGFCLVQVTKAGSPATISGLNITSYWESIT